jgi:hypothetical protein
MIQITEYLGTRPQGATGREIAEYLGVNARSAGDSLARLLRKGTVTNDSNHGRRVDALWRLSKIEDVATPACFRAMETLDAMQKVTRERLVNRIAEEV